MHQVNLKSLNKLSYLILFTLLLPNNPAPSSLPPIKIESLSLPFFNQFRHKWLNWAHIMNNGWNGLNTFQFFLALSPSSFTPWCWSSPWFKTNKNHNLTTGPLARPFARLLALLIHSLAPHYLLRSRATLCSFIRSLTLTSELVGNWIIWCWDIRLFWTIVKW